MINKEKVIGKIKNLNISSYELEDLVNIIESCPKFNFIHKAFLHYCITLKHVLDLELKKKPKGFVKIKIE